MKQKETFPLIHKLQREENDWKIQILQSVCFWISEEAISVTNLIKEIQDCDENEEPISVDYKEKTLKLQKMGYENISRI